jgi:hypothetical protein
VDYAATHVGFDFRRLMRPERLKGDRLPVLSHYVQLQVSTGCSAPLKGPIKYFCPFLHDAMHTFAASVHFFILPAWSIPLEALAMQVPLIVLQLSASDGVDARTRVVTAIMLPMKSHFSSLCSEAKDVPIQA